MKASATHDTICAHNGQPRNRRHGFRDVGGYTVLAAGGVRGGPAGPVIRRVPLPIGSLPPTVALGDSRSQAITRRAVAFAHHKVSA